VGESQTAYHQANTAWLKGRNAHRFGLPYTHGVFMHHSPCGIVWGLTPLFDRELNFVELLTFETVLWPRIAQGEPGIIITDHACVMCRQARPGGHLHNLGLAPQVLACCRCVDRFHYAAHSRSDAICRLECNPHNPGLEGLTKVISRTQVPGRGRNPALTDGIGVKSVSPAGVSPPKTYRTVRYLEHGVWWEYKLEVAVNTAVRDPVILRVFVFNRAPCVSAPLPTPGRRT
jgi:hypothetical protein